MNPVFDLAIVGAGPVGCLTALLAEQRGLNVLLLDAGEAAAEQAPTGDVDLRVVAVAPGSRRLFASVKAWPDSLQSRMQPYTRMQVWDASGNGQIAFDAAELGHEVLGNIVEVPVLQWGLDQALQSSSVTRWHQAQVQRFEQAAEHTELHCSDGRIAQARVLIGADGRDSQLRKRAGIGIERRDYGQQGVVAVLQLERPHQGVARQAFTDIGPLGLLPLPQQQVSIVWSVADAEAQGLLDMPEAAFLQALQQASGISYSKLCSRRVTFPLCLQQAESYAQDNIALVGDAAHVVHPLAGLGMNLGFEDAAKCVEQLHCAERCRSPRAIESALHAYAKQRRREVLPALGVIDGLDRLFGSRSGEVIRLRDTGLNVVNQQALLKRQFMRYALG